jgi:hypothetical protein
MMKRVLFGVGLSGFAGLAAAQSTMADISSAVDFSGVADAGIAVGALIAAIGATFWGIRKVLSLL